MCTPKNSIISGGRGVPYILSLLMNLTCFSYFGLHAKFQNPSTTPSGRKVCDPDSPLALPASFDLKMGSDVYYVKC